MDHDRIRNSRIQYETDGLDIDDLAEDPLMQWHAWHSDAFDAELAEPNAMVLSTVDLFGNPDARVVLIRSADHHGFTFFTNYESAKSHQMTARPVAAATFVWLDHHRQVRIRGSVERVSDAESDDYFSSRPRASQIGAWASPQSEVLRNRHELLESVTDYDRRFHEGEVPRPPHWGGWRIVPLEWEFWQGRPSRLHDRFRYRHRSDGDHGDRGDHGAWTIERLAP